MEVITWVFFYHFQTNAYLCTDKKLGSQNKDCFATYVVIVDTPRASLSNEKSQDDYRSVFHPICFLETYHKPAKKGNVPADKAHNLGPLDRCPTYRVQRNIVHLVVITLCEK